MKAKDNKIKKLFIANRGEIALRIQKSAHKLGIKCCFGISEADKEQSFAKKADQIFIIGPAPVAASYLSIEANIKGAIDSGCDAVHPGYGFLSENADFAEAAIKAGLIWVGPGPESIHLMGSKLEGRDRASRSGVPTVPGTKEPGSDSYLLKEAKKIGYPIIIKAVAGGGGRGMRIVSSEAELKAALPLAKSEALKNFSDESIFLEKFISQPKHVEVQVLGDKFGNLIHLGTRDCSTQRRHQKLVEEAPAPFLSDALRAKIQKAALNAARSVNYYSVGTVEFLVEKNSFYFLEMNTRIQVEHPVTEMISGIDLIEQQLLIAQGEKLKITQKNIKFSGHAIEFRINAEDADENFSPTSGEITRINLPEPQDPSVRADFGFASSDKVTLYYDGLLGKLIIHDTNRKKALQKSLRVLEQFKIQGLITNLEFHRWLLRTKIFNQKGLDIGFISREFSSECLRDLRAAEALDVENSDTHFASKDVSLRQEYVIDRKDGSKSDTIYLEKRPDGTYLATGRDSKNRAKKAISNSKKTAIEALL